MKYNIDRLLRTKNLEWFTFNQGGADFSASLVINDLDRSKDFSEDPMLEDLKKFDQSIGEEYLKVHLYVTSKKILDESGQDIIEFYDKLLHNLNIHSWLFVHEVAEPFNAAQEYLKKWVDDKNLLTRPNSHPAFYHLSQD